MDTASSHQEDMYLEVGAPILAPIGGIEKDSGLMCASPHHESKFLEVRAPRRAMMDAVAGGR